MDITPILSISEYVIDNSSIKNNDYVLRKKKKYLSEVGFEPTPTFVDQNTRYEGIYLESGALDHSAILTTDICMSLYKFIFEYNNTFYLTGYLFYVISICFR